MKPGDLFRTQGSKDLYKRIGSLYPTGKIPWNTVGIILEIHNPWLKILLPSGITRWCSTQKIKVL